MKILKLIKLWVKMMFIRNIKISIQLLIKINKNLLIIQMRINKMDKMVSMLLKEFQIGKRLEKDMFIWLNGKDIEKKKVLGNLFLISKILRKWLGNSMQISKSKN